MFSIEIFDTPPPLLLIHNLLRHRKLSETQHRTVPLQSFFGTVRQKKSTKNRDITPLSTKFFDTWNQRHPRGFPYQFFRHWDKMFSAENFDTPPPSPSFSSTNFFATGNFPKHSTGRFPCNVLWHCETEKIDKKPWHNPLKHKIFRYPKSVTP